MHLLIFNGSPRGEKSNTRIVMGHFIKGFTEDKQNTVENFYLKKTSEIENMVGHFKKADHVILAFPLYTDAMPGIVKQFIEALEPLCGKKSNPSLGFVVQSGFPESIHCRFVARYMEKLAGRLGCVFTGTVRRGGVEGIQVQPAWMTRKLFGYFFKLGKEYASTGFFNPDIIHKLSSRERLSPVWRFIFSILGALGVTNMYWNMKLKEHKSFENRFARPFD